MSYDKQLSDVWFLSFADSRLKRPLKRIAWQAKKFGFRDEHILIATEENLDAQFRDRMRKYLVLGSRGFGYWSWKPQMVLQMFDKMPYQDVLIYSDAGVHLHASGKDRMLEYIALAREHGVVAFQHTGESFQERFWTKGDVFDLFNIREKDEITSTGQVAATAFILSKNDKTLSFVNHWRNAAFEHFDIWSNTTSTAENFDGFREHRFDQSFFSVLFKLSNFHTISHSELLSKGNPKFPLYACHDNQTGWRAYFIPFGWKLLCILPASFQTKIKHLPGLKRLICRQSDIK